MKESTEHAPVLRTIMTILSFLTALGALGYAGNQTRIANNAISAQVWQGVNQSLSDLDKIFIDHPELRPYFYDRKEIKRDDPEYNKVMAMAEAYLDFIENFADEYIHKQEGMGEGGSAWVIWERYFKDMFATSPALCIRSKEIPHWYSTDFTKYAPSDCSTIASKTTSNPYKAIEPTVAAGK